MIKKSLKEMSASKRFKEFVIMNMLDSGYTSYEEAEEKYNQSCLPALLRDDPMFVYHYDADYWAKQIG